ncbi:MAG TPA: endonuclease/exonuclease/phosphatase family protein [Opitutaceae bacterium]|nr:endonuclease/exonuclease/phosphatase family protein [Opitutaceae bacterium]
MFAAVEAFAHRLRRRISRSEWAVRHLGVEPSEGTSEEPGLLLIQIDGFARSQLERAMAKGRMPFLRRLMKRNHYVMHSFYPGLPSTTPAVQAELYFGVRAAVPAFSFFDRTTQQRVRMYSPERAKQMEAKCAAQAEGLLKGGSSWSNIYTGGAGQEESHFCIATNGPADMWRTGKIRNIFVFALLQFPALLRILGLLVVETGVGLWQAFAGIFRGESPFLELSMLVSRVFIGIGARELITIGAKVDVARGLPVVHVNYVGYDEHAHRRGPGSLFAHWSLFGIDRSIRDLWRAAHRSHRRDYRVWIFSDHGQERTESLAEKYPGSIERTVEKFLGIESTGEPERLKRRRRARRESAWESLGPGARRRRRAAAAADAQEETAPFVLSAMGPVAHLYFKEALSDERRHTLALQLVSESHVPGILIRNQAGEVRWIHAKGEARVPEEAVALLPHPQAIKEEIARDLVTLCLSEHAGDLVLIGWSPWAAPATFAYEKGAHGGFGPEEAGAFALLPARTRLPEGAHEFIRPGALRSAALHHLGRSPFPNSVAAARSEPRLRLMTYNTHGCGGMDGRVSPRRIARVIGEHRPDIVALQELDLGRRRSRVEDQAAIIAQELGLHAVFCPTITRGEEHYGHALLSHWPIEVVNRSRLPHDDRSWFKEPRSAIWARVQVAGQPVNVITTHLGLGVKERALQMQMLLGKDWIGGIPETEPVILCGDFNCLPRSVPYNLAAKRLLDVQKNRRPLSTFSSTKPMVRLDHIFVSPHVTCEGVFVPRNDLTRVASDHLPLMADLHLQGTVAAPRENAVPATERAEASLAK